jgi:hypothetical protein
LTAGELQPLKAKDPLKITPAPPGNNRGGERGRLPTRADLAGARVLHRGERNKADLLLLDLGDGPMVVKDFATKAWWVRLLGRLQIAREHRAYRVLGRLPGVPRLVCRVDALALAIERVEAEQLGKAPDRRADGAAKLAALREVVSRFHAVGLAHLDLRARENVLVSPAGQVYVVDFASAVSFRPGSLGHRLLFPWFRRVDESALLKWKVLLEAGRLSDRERAFLKRHAFWRSLWIFNPRGRGKRPRGTGGQGTETGCSSDDAK